MSAMKNLFTILEDTTDDLEELGTGDGHWFDGPAEVGSVFVTSEEDLEGTYYTATPSGTADALNFESAVDVVTWLWSDTGVVEGWAA